MKNEPMEEYPSFGTKKSPQNELPITQSLESSDFNKSLPMNSAQREKVSTSNNSQENQQIKPTSSKISEKISLKEVPLKEENI